MSKGRKLPKQAATPQSAKIPRQGAQPENVHRMQFRWTLIFADFDGPYGWRNLPIEKLFTDTIKKLHEFEAMTWGEIETQSEGRHHFVPTGSWSAVAVARLADTEFSGEPRLFSLRLEGGIRVWGKREGAVFQILWYDPEHGVCPYIKQ